VKYPEVGGYPHPDHIRCHEVSVQAIDAAADEWQVRKLYYSSIFNRKRLQVLHDTCVAEGIESPFGEWLERWDPDEPDLTTTSVEVGDFIAQRTQALIAHATQVDPAGLWFKVPDEVIRRVYPYEDYVLIWSKVETGLPEATLFAGLE
jgi:mycothiol S-conjugate amidase